jgi:glycosyltransferase involved in cell wall biosynthesis
MNPEPLVSVIINCYNGDKYLRQAIDSVLAQTYRNWEIIFWDNQSTDQSAEIVQSYADPRLKYFYAPSHTWLYEARNYAIERAAGDFLAFLDVDDWWLPIKLQKQIRLFSDPEVGLVCANFWVHNERKNKRWVSLKRRMPTGWVLDELLRSYFVGLLTLVVRRTALASLDYPCDPRYHIMGDTDLVIRLSIRWKLDCVQEPMAFLRLHGGNEVAKHRTRHLVELKCWLQEMQQVKDIGESPSFPCVTNLYSYLTGMYHILQGDKKNARLPLRDLPWGNYKLRLCLALLLPTAVARKIKN